VNTDIQRSTPDETSEYSKHDVHFDGIFAALLLHRWMPRW
jgi:hypothetical protein